MVAVRNYTDSDRNAVESISYDTAFFGDSFSELGMNRSLWCELAVKYYVEKEPQSIFIAEDDGKVVGYLFGCLDDKGKSDYEEKQFPRWTRVKKIINYYLRSSANTKYFIKYYIFKYRKEKFFFPKNAGHLHINLIKEYRGRGVGRLLMEKFFEYAKSKGTSIIHADSFQALKNITKEFWEKLGFHEFSRTRTGLWKKFFPDEEIYLVCYVIRI